MNKVNVHQIISYVSKLKVESFDNSKLVDENSSVLILILNEIEHDDPCKQGLINLLMDKEYRMSYLLALKNVLTNNNQENFSTLKLVTSRYSEDKKVDLNKWFVVSVFLACFYPTRDFIIEENMFEPLLVDNEFISYDNYKIISNKLDLLKVKRVKTMNLDNLTFYNYLNGQKDE